MTSALCVLCPQRADRPPRQAEVGNGCPACAARLRNTLCEIDELAPQLADQDLEVDGRTRPLLDEDGNPVLDEHGQPMGRPADPVAAALPAGPTVAPADGSRISGTAEARPPLSVERLDMRGDAATHVTEPLVPLIGTWRVPGPHLRAMFAGRVVLVGMWLRAQVVDERGRPVMVPLGDQVGELPPRVLLEQWVIEWRARRGWRPVGFVNDCATAEVYTRWLLVRLGWALAHHPALPDFAAEMRNLAARMRAAAGVDPPQPVRKPASIPCRNDRCDARGTLYQHPGEDWIECGACGLILTETEYQEWVARLAAYERSRARRGTP